MSKRLSNLEIQNLKGQRPITSVTAYDFYGAKLAQEADVDFILVGDSLGFVVQGHDSTLKVTLDQMVYHTEMVSRGAPETFIVADLPYMTFHVNTEETVRAAGRLIVEGGAQAVKLEGGHKRVPMIQACLDAEIPVMGHIGLTPQSLNALGGYKVQDDRERLLSEAKILEETGVFAIVLEAMPSGLAAEISKSISIPTIGIGAGIDCDGQIIVFHDVLGWHNGHMAKFVKAYSNLWQQGVEGLSTYVSEVRERKYPDAEHSYKGTKKQEKKA